MMVNMSHCAATMGDMTHIWFCQKLKEMQHSDVFSFQVHVRSAASGVLAVGSGHEGNNAFRQLVNVS